MWRSAWWHDVLLVLMPFLAACNGCGGSNGVIDGGSDMEEDASDGLLDGDVGTDDIGLDVPGEDAVATDGDGYACFDTADLRYDTSAWDVVSFMPDRPGRDCGPNCRQVSFAAHDVWNPNYEVWGNYLVLNTMNEGSPGRKQVLLVDLVTLTHRLIHETVSEPDGEANGWTEIHGNTILFSYLRDWWKQYLYEFDTLSGETEMLIPFDDLYPVSGYTQMYCNWVVYEDNYGDYDVRIILFDLNTGARNPISTITGDGLEPSIHDGRIAYQDNYGGFTNIGVYDIEAASVVWFLEGAWDKAGPSIYGDTVVWTDTRNGGRISNPTFGDIYMVDLSTGSESPVCENEASQSWSYIWGKWVVWADHRNDPLYPNNPTASTERDIYAKNLETGEEVQVSSMPGREEIPKVFENRVYFLAWDDEGIWSVFEATLE